MNGGLLGFPAQRADLGPAGIVRAALKLVGTSVTVDGLGPTAGMKYPDSALKLAYNIEKVVYNAAGDFTVHFTNPMPSEHFIVIGMGNSTGGTDYPIVAVDPSDTGVADRKRIQTADQGGTEQNYAQVHLLFLA